MIQASAAPYPTTAHEPRIWLDWLVPALVIAYLTMSRTFAHIGIGPLYVGEIALGAILIAAPQAIVRPWLQACARRSPFSNVALWMYVFIAYGAIQAVRGVMNGYNPMIALQNLVFHVYPLFFFVGVWVGVRHPNMLPKLIRVLAWIHGVYGLLFVCLLSPMGLGELSEGEDPVMGYIGWFGNPSGAALVLLGLLCFERNLTRVWIPLLLNVFVLIAMMVRASWIGFALAVSTWAILSGRTMQAFKIATLVAVVLLIGCALDVRLPGPQGGEKYIAAREVVGRIVAIVNPELAADFTENAAFHAGTLDWRTTWWTSIVDNVHERSDWTWFGPGYGYPIWDLPPVAEQMKGRAMRTPHNIFVHCLGYTGWVGVMVFVVFLLALFVLMWTVYQQTGQPFGICYLVLILFWATFDDILEAPYRAIPFYLLLGLAAAPIKNLMDSRREQQEHP